MRASIGGSWQALEGADWRVKLDAKWTEAQLACHGSVCLSFEIFFRGGECEVIRETLH